MEALNTTNLMPWIAGYAAIISTAALGWNIITFIQQNKAKIKVSAYITASFQAIPDIGTVSDTTWNLSIDIINQSKSKRYINRPLIVLPKEINGSDRFQCISFNNNTNYPVSLDPGEKHQYNMQLGESLLRIIDNHKVKKKKMRIVVSDTFGKNYYSNKVKISNLIEHCKKEN
jgi:hypothetical protein